MPHIFDGCLVWEGDKQSSFMPQQFYTIDDEQILLKQKQFVSIAKHLRHIVVLKQTHSTKGYAITNEQESALYKPYCLEGDYLITTVLGVGLAVATADCLPIVMLDPGHGALAVVHAGWRGSVEGIACRALEHMCQITGGTPRDVRVWFGPSARACCYEVDETFYRTWNYYPEAGSVRGGKYFFDVPTYNRMQLERQGVLPDSFRDERNICTICSPRYCSYRRDKEHAMRQMTIGILQERVGS